MRLGEALIFNAELLLGKRVSEQIEKGKDWASFVVTDGKLVTGQNPASSEDAARALLVALL